MPIMSVWNPFQAVEAYTASWIEIFDLSYILQNPLCRSLYGFVDWNVGEAFAEAVQDCRSLYGFVDWNNWQFNFYVLCACRSLYGFVDWNIRLNYEGEFIESRSLYGFVDWNSCAENITWNYLVEAYTASWIEMGWKAVEGRGSRSKPIRLRGLKLQLFATGHRFCCRSLYGFVDWNFFHYFIGAVYPVEAYTASWIEFDFHLP